MAHKKNGKARSGGVIREFNLVEFHEAAKKAGVSVELADEESPPACADFYCGGRILSGSPLVIRKAMRGRRMNKLYLFHAHHPAPPEEQFLIVEMREEEFLETVAKAAGYRLGGKRKQTPKRRSRGRHRTALVH